MPLLLSWLREILLGHYRRRIERQSSGRLSDLPPSAAAARAAAICTARREFMVESIEEQLENLMYRLLSKSSVKRRRLKTLDSSCWPLLAGSGFQRRLCMEECRI